MADHIPLYQKVHPIECQYLGCTQSLTFNGSTTYDHEELQNNVPIKINLITNFIVENERKVVELLSHFFGKRYNRSSTIIVSIRYNSCLMVGGSWEPAYSLDITTLPNELTTCANRRNAYLVQSYLAAIVGVPSDRGFIHFIEVHGDKLATNGCIVGSAVQQTPEPTNSRENLGTAPLLRALSKRSWWKVAAGRGRSQRREIQIT